MHKATAPTSASVAMLTVSIVRLRFSRPLRCARYAFCMIAARSQMKGAAHFDPAAAMRALLHVALCRSRQLWHARDVFHTFAIGRSV